MSAAAAASGKSDYISILRLRSGERNQSTDGLSAEDAINLVKNLNANASLFLSIPGSYHNIIGLVRSQVDYDFLLRPEDEIAKGCHLIPHRVIADGFDHHLQAETLVPKLRQVASCRVYVLACPPPKRDNEFMMKRLLAKWNKPYRGQDIAANGLSRPELRRKLWVLECERLKAWASQIDIDYVGAPQACFDADGFLAEKFYASDATHANEEYGRLVLQLVSTLINR